MINEKSAGIIVYYSENENPIFLLLKYTNYWGFAKGWIEPGESEEQAALREVKEETNLNVKIIPGFKDEQSWFYRLNGETVSKKAVFFLAEIPKTDSEKVRISEEHEDFRWLGFEEAVRIMKIKANKEMLSRALEFIKERMKQKKLS